MTFASNISRRSYDERYQVGAIVVTGDNCQVLAVGYNGNYSGGPNEVESSEPGQSGMIHAEINALLKMDYNNPKKKKLSLDAIAPLLGGNPFTISAKWRKNQLMQNF